MNRFFFYFFCLLAAIGRMILFAQSRLEIREIDVATFPEVTLKSIVLNDNLRLESLRANGFSVMENGKNVQANIVCPVHPMHVSLLLDKSLSMRFYPDTNIIDPKWTRWKLSKSAISMFIDLLQREDEASLITFDGNVRVDQGFTLDRQLLHSALDSVMIGSGGTAMWNALRKAIFHLDAHPAPKAIVLLSDGMDSYGRDGIYDVVGRALEANIRIYPIGLGKYIDRGVLDSLATMTGGRFYFSTRGDDLSEIYRQIAGALTEPCTITYTTPNNCGDGNGRIVTLSYSDASHSLRSDTMYTAPRTLRSVTLSSPALVISDDKNEIHLPCVLTPLALPDEPVRFEAALQYPSPACSFSHLESAIGGFDITQVTIADDRAGTLRLSYHAQRFNSTDSILFTVVFAAHPQAEVMEMSFGWADVIFDQHCPTMTQSLPTRVLFHGICERILAKKHASIISSIFPNPAVSSVTVDLTLPKLALEGCNATITVLDAIGNVAYQTERFLSSQQMPTSVTLPLLSKPAGTYYLLLTACGEKVLRSFVLY